METVSLVTGGGGGDAWVSHVVTKGDKLHLCQLSEAHGGMVTGAPLPGKGPAKASAKDLQRHLPRTCKGICQGPAKASANGPERYLPTYLRMALPKGLPMYMSKDLPTYLLKDLQRYLQRYPPKDLQRCMSKVPANGPAKAPANGPAKVPAKGPAKVHVKGPTKVPVKDLPMDLQRYLPMDLQRYLPKNLESIAECHVMTEQPVISLYKETNSRGMKSIHQYKLTWESESCENFIFSGKWGWSVKTLLVKMLYSQVSHEGQ